MGRQLDPADLEAAATGVMRLSRVFDRVRSHMVEDPQQIADYTDLWLLFTLVKHGPMRASALASAVHSDASTISRQVASLVRRDLVERQADPHDGRVSLLVATEAAHHLVKIKSEARDEYFGHVLADWDPAEFHTFAPLLTRLADDLERHWQEVVAGGHAGTAHDSTDTPGKAHR